MKVTLEYNDLLGSRGDYTRKVVKTKQGPAPSVLSFSTNHVEVERNRLVALKMIKFLTPNTKTAPESIPDNPSVGALKAKMRENYTRLSR